MTTLKSRLSFVKANNYKVGLNLLKNRLHSITNIVDKKWIVEIDENSMLNFRKGDEVHGMARARLATKVAQEHGFKGYIGVSLLEMEYSQNEAAYLLKSLGPIFEEIKQTIKA